MMPTEETEQLSKPPRHVYYYDQAKSLLMGTHPYSKQASVFLLFIDALLTSLIITYIPCKLLSQIMPLQPALTLSRYRNRLDDLHGTYQALHRWRKRLHEDLRRYRSSRLSGGSCYHILGAVPCHGTGEEYIECAKVICCVISRDYCARHGMLQKGEGLLKSLRWNIVHMLMGTTIGSPLHHPYVDSFETITLDLCPPPLQ